MTIMDNPSHAPGTVEKALSVLQSNYARDQKGTLWRFVYVGRAWFWRCCGERGFKFRAFHTKTYPTHQTFEREGTRRVVCGVCGQLNNLD